MCRRDCVKFQGPLNGGFQTGGFSRAGLVLPLCPFCLGTFRFSVNFPIGPFPLSRPIKLKHLRGTVPKVRDTILTFPEKSGNSPRFGTPRFSFSCGGAPAKLSQKIGEVTSENVSLQVLFHFLKKFDINETKLYGQKMSLKS